MARASIPTDTSSLKRIVEAMIFASEEPLPPRTLLRLLFEDESKGKKGNGSGVPDDRTLFDESEDRPEEETGAEGETSDMEEETEAGEVEAETESEAEEEQHEEETGAEEETSDVEGETEAGEVEAETESESESEEEQPEEETSGKIGQKELRGIIAELNEEYEAERRAFRIVEIAGGFQFATTREFGEFVGLLSKERSRRRLSPASLETLSIVAYRQPVTKPEVEAIRGVNCDQVLLSLLERNLIAITGRSDAVGKPLLYGTTEDFLRAFGLNSLSDLPKLRELEELMEDDAYLASRPEGAVAEVTQELLELDNEEEGNRENGGEDAKSEDAEREVAEGRQGEAPVESEGVEVERAASGNGENEDEGDQEQGETVESEPAGSEEPREGEAIPAEVKEMEPPASDKENVGEELSNEEKVEANVEGETEEVEERS